MSLRGMSQMLLALCLLGGLVSAFFAPAIASTLTLSPGAKRTASLPALTPLPGEPANEPTPLPDGEMILARDTFQRPNQQFWGTSSDDRTWGGDANTSADFTIVEQMGQITSMYDSVAMQATLNVTVDNAELLLSGSVNRFDANGDINLGSVLRWVDANNWYKLFIDGSRLELLRDLHGTQHVLASVPFKATGGTGYSLRFRAQGSYLLGKVWPENQTEPANWMFTVIDTALTSGISGVRVLLAPKAVISVTSFLVTSVPNHM